MNVLLVLAHPERRSFNGAMFDTAQATLQSAGHTVVTSDLYRMGFDPISSRRNFVSVKDADYLKLQVEEMWASEVGGFAPDLEAEIAKIEAADLMIWQFPLWWFGMPAILKGWVDRVFAMGRTYGNGHIYETGKFKGKRALLSLTTGGPEAAYLEDGFNGDLNAMLRPMQRGMLNFTGFSVLQPQVVYGPVRVDDAQRRVWLAQWAQRLRAIESEAAIAVGRY
ncbi:MAG: NAD(P)H-dependent oxidoreductase [Burkholderiaceae bacterium]|jgi:NAD(P)H dehydrogenase (quinone)|nr:NAD(P)H-dependent oxidoreductase [Burkholderiaceae bacterium]